METVVAWFKVPYRNLPGGTEESHEKHQDGWFPDRHLNPRLPEYEAVLLTTRPVHSVIIVVVVGVIIIIIILLQAFYFPGTYPLEPMVNPTTQASSFKLWHIPYYVRCS
jgi:hypothetical protein